MTEKLLPCPFCGQPPETQESGVGGTGLMIFCISDNCPNPHTSYYSHDSARRVWNRRASGWQPIETAPKDGTWFLICRAGKEDFFEVGRYRPFFVPKFVEVEDGIYRKELKAVFDWDGFNNIHRATHWMPIPPAPQGEG